MHEYKTLLENLTKAEKLIVLYFVLLFNSTALECFKELITRCKYDTLMQLIEKEDGWTPFEDEKTFPDGVCVIARYVWNISALAKL